MFTIDPPPRVFIDLHSFLQKKERRTQVHRHRWYPTARGSRPPARRGRGGGIVHENVDAATACDDVADNLAARFDAPQIASHGIDVAAARPHRVRGRRRAGEIGSVNNDTTRQG